MRSLTFVLLASLIAGTSAPAQQGREEERVTIAVNIDLVVFNATVTDSKGRHVSGLTAGDFRIFEDSRPQDIALFTADEVPASVGLILDNSGSMLDKRADLIQAALAFVDASHPDDEMFVVNFNEKVSLGLPPAIRFTNDADQLGAALLAAPTGLTALYDALAVGLSHLDSGTLDRKALVVFSDGGDNASRRSLDEVVQIARRSNATIYTIGLYDETNRDRNPRVLRQLAELSGGRAYFPGSTRDLSKVWRDIADGIRNQYTIGYQSDSAARDGLFRKVLITASRNGNASLRVTTREGYVGPTDRTTAR